MMVATAYLLLSFISACLSIVTMPPLIAQQPDKLVVFEIGKPIQLPCIAAGQPPPSYSWTYNGLPYESDGTDNRVQRLPGVGTIVFNNPGPSDQGFYQCQASNQLGIAVSDTVRLLNATMDSFTREVRQVVTVKLGSSLTFSCNSPSSFPPAVIYWQKLDARFERYVHVNHDARVSLDLDGNLHFANIIQSDAGNYKCNSHNRVLRRTSASRDHQIVISGSSSTSWVPVQLLYASPVNFIAYLGQPLHLKCIFGGMPTPFVSWLRGDGTPVNTSYVSGYGLAVFIPRAAYTDAGTYECRGYNTASTNPGTATFKVNVYAKPYFVTMPTPQIRSIGESVTFICEGGGIPKPITKWFTNGDLTVASRGKVILNGNNMTVVNLTFEDSMAIQCNITDEHSGWEAVSFYINVLNEPPVIFNPPPKFLKMADGLSYSLDCGVFGAPRPVISWKKDGRDLTGGRFVQYDNGTLEILRVHVTDAGNYTCIAFNSVGRDSASTSAVVRRQTQIRTAPKDTVVHAGQETKLLCTATTDGDELQNLVVNWQKDGQWIEETAGNGRIYKSVQDNSLLISGTTSLDTGMYTCVASSGVDSASAAAALRVQDVPDRPTEVTIMECRQATARVSWKPGQNNNAPVLNYILQYNTSFDQSVWYTVSNSISDKDNEYTVPLSPYVSYTFRVLARNKLGTSRPSEPSSHAWPCTTQPDVPTTNPTGVTTLNEDPSWLVIAWQPTAEIDQSGRGFRYIITYKKWDANHREFVCSPPNQCSQTYVPQNGVRGGPGQDRSEETKIYIRDVDTYTPYLIYVTTANEKGASTGRINKIVGFSGEGAPEVSVTDFRPDPLLPATSTSASFVWSLTDTSGASSVFGFFRGYRIRYWIASSADANEAVLKATVYIIIHDDALEGKDYDVDAEATNDGQRRSAVDAWEPAPGASSVQTAERACSLHGLNSSSSAAVVARARHDGHHSACIDGSLVRATVHNLPPYSQLSFEISIINKRFSGPNSAAVIVQTLPGYPGPVATLAVVERGPTHVLLTWSPPSEPNGELTGYSISYRTLDQLQLGAVQYPDRGHYDAAATSAKVSGLRYTQRYRFTVCALTSLGPGAEHIVDATTEAPGYPLVPVPSVVSIPDCNNCLNVSWAAAGGAGGMPASVHYVQYRQNSARDSWQSTAYEPYRSWIKLMNLDSGWVYEVRVVASNGDGYEVASASLTINPSGELRSTMEALGVFRSPWLVGLLTSFALLTIVVVLAFVRKQNENGPSTALNSTSRDSAAAERLHSFNDTCGEDACHLYENVDACGQDACHLYENVWPSWNGSELTLSDLDGSDGLYEDLAPQWASDEPDSDMDAIYSQYTFTPSYTSGISGSIELSILAAEPNDYSITVCMAEDVSQGPAPSLLNPHQLPPVLYQSRSPVSPRPQPEPVHLAAPPSPTDVVHTVV